MPENTQNFNRYSYCLNNPLKFTDPSGYLAAPLNEYWNLDKTFNQYTRFHPNWDGTDGGQDGWGGGGGALPGWMPRKEWNGKHDYYYSCGNYYKRESGNMVSYDEVYSYERATGQFQAPTDENMESIGWKKDPSISTPGTLQILSPTEKSKQIAYFIHNSARTLIGAPNPFEGANAIFGDIGYILGGTEMDIGGFFILTGEEAGAFYPYLETGPLGVGSNYDIGIEVGRVDWFGNPDDFLPEFLYGDRTKIYGGYSLCPPISLGIGVAVGREEGHFIIEVGVSVSAGASFCEPYSIGVNFWEKNYW